MHKRFGTPAALDERSSRWSALSVFIVAGLLLCTNNVQTARAQSGTLQVVVDRASVRASPSVTAPLVGTLAKGTTVTVAERTGSWVRVAAAGVTGYVHTSALGLLSPGSGQTAVTERSLATPRDHGGGDLSLGISGGASSPLRGLKAAASTGWRAAARLELRVAGPIALGVEGAYSRLSGRRLLSETLPSPTLWSIGGHFRVGGHTGPYFVGGAGSYHFRSVWPEGAEEASVLGVSAGLGLRFRVGRLGTFLEARVENVNYKNGLVVPISLGFVF